MSRHLSDQTFASQVAEYAAVKVTLSKDFGDKKGRILILRADQWFKEKSDLAQEIKLNSRANFCERI